MTRVRKVLTFSNVIACLALFMALGGTVYAAGKISGTQIQPSSIPGNRLEAKAVGTNQLKAKAVGNNQLKANAVTGAKIAAQTITPGKIKPGSLTGTQINQTTLTGVSAASIGSVFYVTASGSVPGSGNPSHGTSVTASCPPATFVIGGGATVKDEEKDFVNDSGPNTTHTSWTATLFGAPNDSITVTAICTAVKTVG